MIEMRRAAPEERQAVARLWNRVFGDDEKFLDEFYRLCTPYEELMVLVEDGVLRTILCAPDITLRCPNGRQLKAGYMYALATDPAIRGRGFGKDMMRFGEVCLKGRGADCAILVPAEPSLFRFFDQLSYVPVFSHIRQVLSPDELPAPQPGDRLTPAAPTEYNAIRREQLAGQLYTDYGDDLVEFQQLLSRAAGGGIWRLELPGGIGCAAVEVVDDVPVVKELLCPPEDIDRAASLLARQYPAPRCILRLPPWCNREGERVTWGAVRWLYDHPSPWCPPGEVGYLGLAFD